MFRKWLESLPWCARVERAGLFFIGRSDVKRLPAWSIFQDKGHPGVAGGSFFNVDICCLSWRICRAIVQSLEGAGAWFLKAKSHWMGIFLHMRHESAAADGLNNLFASILSDGVGALTKTTSSLLLECKQCPSYTACENYSRPTLAFPVGWERSTGQHAFRLKGTSCERMY